MSHALRLAVGPVVCALVLAGALPAAQGAPRAALPETVVVHDGRTSAPIVDISKVRLDASWYWDSTQGVAVTVPGGFRPGHRLTVWFDMNHDNTPDGHYDLRLGDPTRPGGKWLRRIQEFRVGGGWTLGGKRVRCSDSEGGPPASDIRMKQREIRLGLELWWCMQLPNPADSGAWRAAVEVAKGKNVDMAPNHHKWSAPVAGWGPCDPGGGQCP